MNRAALQSLESPFHRFTRDEWAQLRADTQLTLTIDDLRKLQSTHDPISLDEVVAIYLPLSRLLALYVAATQGLFKATQRFLGATDGKVPYIIGIAGSVAAGKSTTARVLQALLTRWPNTPKVQLVTTDGFLRPNAELIRQGIMDRKGFPESYDGTAVLRFLSAVKAGQHNVARSRLFAHHLRYRGGRDRSSSTGPTFSSSRASTSCCPTGCPGTAKRFRSFPTFSTSRSSWTPTMRCWSNGISSASWACGTTAFRDPRSYFRQYADLDDAEAEATARSIWRRINLVNLHENILPTRPRADLLLTKGRKPPDRRSRAEKAVSVIRRLALSACAFLLGVLTLSLAQAEPPKACQGSDLTQVEGLAAAETARADDLVNGDGLLWRIEKPGLAPSYLFGTIHSTDESALEVARRAAQFDQRRQGRGDRTRRAYRLHRESQHHGGDAGQGARSRP